MSNTPTTPPTPAEALFVPPPQRQPLTAAQEQLIAQAVAEIAATADLHPAVTIIHNLALDAVAYMSERGLRLLHTTLAELQALGPAYTHTHFNPEDAPNYLPQLYGLVQSLDPQASVTFFQQVRTATGRDFAWYLTTTRVLLREPDGPPLLMISTACPIDPLHHVTQKVQRLLDENNFLRRHARQFATLTARERDVLRLLALGFSAPDVAGQLNISVQTAETHRRNLRQKLSITSAFDLGQYARAFDLI